MLLSQARAQEAEGMKNRICHAERSEAYGISLKAKERDSWLCSLHHKPGRFFQTSVQLVFEEREGPEFAITDFSLHAIGIALARLGWDDALARFVADTFERASGGEFPWTAN